MTDRAPIWSEARVALEPLRILRHQRALRAAPKGSGPVVVLPGYLTDDRTTLPLRLWLGSRGYDARGWGLGLNRGRVGGVLPDLLALLQTLTEPAALIGWSWGGVVARELARSAPEHVRYVITLGSPLQGGIEATAFGTRASQEEKRLSKQQASDRESRPITVPALSIYTRGDGVVAWSSSRDPVIGRTGTLEVASCHCGLVLNPQVWLAIAETLSRPHSGGA